MIRDMKRLAQEWQVKRERLKRVVIISALTVLAVLVSVIWNLSIGNTVRWWGVTAIAVIGCGVFFISLSAYMNTMLVSMYYMACYHLLASPDKLEMMTGTIEEVSRIKMPYIGMLYQVTLLVAGKRMRFYCPGRLLRGLHPRERIRVQTHELFVVRVESTGQFDLEPQSTKTA